MDRKSDGWQVARVGTVVVGLVAMVVVVVIVVVDKVGGGSGPQSKKEL